MNRFQRLDQLFHLALDQSPSDRAAFLREQCSGDEELFQELMEMLTSSDEETKMDRHFQGIVAAGAQLTETPIPPSELGGHSIRSPTPMAHDLRIHLVELARGLMASGGDEASGLWREANAILVLDALLADLSVYPAVVEVLELCYFAELSPGSAASVSGVSTQEAHRWYRVSRALLIHRIGDLNPHPAKRRASRLPEAGA